MQNGATDATPGSNLWDYIYRKAKKIIPNDDGPPKAEDEDYANNEYADYILPMEFAKVSVVGTGLLPAVSVQLYLDDTSNFDSGMGNTRFLHMTSENHGDEKGNMHIANVKWPMCGVLKPGEEEGVYTPVKMPDVGKVVVTGEARMQQLCNGHPKLQHGVMGGTAFPLQALMDAMKKEGSGVYAVPIYNSFVGTQLGTDPLARVVFYRKGDGIDLLKDFENKVNNLFQPSKLPDAKQAYVLAQLLPPAINELWTDRIDQV